MNFSNQHREKFIQELSSQQFDLLVIGGGITGCGIALDAALRGMKVALVEQNDFASGTSSRSTKLIHGGLRYLKQYEFKLVFDVGREREIVHRNARHLVIPEKMLLPITKDGSLNMYEAAVGLFVYDALAGVRPKEWKKMLDKQETLKAEPLLGSNKLEGGGLYYEYKTDDARLTIEVAKSAHVNGAILLNYASVQNFIYDAHKKVTGVTVLDKASNNAFEVKAKTIVNACGPWVDMLRKMDNSLQGKRLLLTKGVHIVFPSEKLPVKQAVYFDTPDKRMMFVIPHGNVTYAGTTDTVYNEALEKPHCTKEDATYLLNAVNNMFPTVHLQLKDIESSWAGLRPLLFEEGKSPSEVSRKDEILISASGLISIAGGKLTGYRLMAEKIVNVAVKKSGINYGKSKTKDFRLSGSEFKNEDEFNDYKHHLISKGGHDNIPVTKLTEWFNRYGKNVTRLIENVNLLRNEHKEDETVFDHAELLYCIENEMVYSPSDFFTRRTGKLFFDHAKTEKQIDTLGWFLAERLKIPVNVFQREVTQVKEEFKEAVGFM